MSNTGDQLFRILHADEGTGPMHGGRHMPYFDCCGVFFRNCKCAKQGKLTIGYGHNLEAKGFTAAQASQISKDDVREAVADLVVQLPWVESLDPVRQSVLVMMTFQMGIGSSRTGKGLLGFRRALDATQQGDYETAAVLFLQSKWAEQDSPKRALRLMEMFRTGEWPNA